MNKAIRHLMRSSVVRTSVAILALAAWSVSAQSQSPLVPPAALKQPLARDWPIYSGDYTGQRFSALTQVDRGNVKHLTLAWTARMNTTVLGTVVTGGEGKGDFPIGPASMKGAVLEVN